MFWNEVENYLRNQGGRATVTGQRGHSYRVELDSAHHQVLLLDSPNLKPIPAEAFNEVERCLQRGITKKGCAHGRLGTEKLNENTIMYQIGYNVYHKQNGDSMLDPAHYIFAILAAAGCVINCWGYLR